MGRRYAFELFYPVARVADALTALDRYAPSIYRKRRGELVRVPERVAPPDLTGLTPETPRFWSTSLLFPADDEVRRFCSGRENCVTEWDDEGNGCLPVGSIDVAVRVGGQFAALRFAACTSGMSDLFERSRPIWRQFHNILQTSGGLTAIFDGATALGRQPYPVSPDGTTFAEFDYRDFILEERDDYWHLDTDRYARAVLRAT